MKVACMDASVEGGKHVVWDYTQVMHASVKTFMETDFSSYLHLGELDIEGLRRLCIDSEVEDNQPKGSSSKGGSSSSPVAFV
ncbi:unnamed protein product [Lactuca virosa]|uniref:Uncharacterized protein n=1 Tax=Lactuca virosa TaxID=75947 RepID=A0AAU9MR36_9ASTR|nr:unnamed protein product [Lactuca virosa]